jgi:hypothetical protein
MAQSFGRALSYDGVRSASLEPPSSTQGNSRGIRHTRRNEPTSAYTWYGIERQPIPRGILSDPAGGTEAALVKWRA